MRILIGICLIFFWETSCSNEKKESIWSTLESIDGSKPVARHEAAFCKVSDKFYLLGGRGIRPVSIFDPQTKKWTEGTPPPIELHHFQPVVYNHKVYIMGAFTGEWPNETPVDSIIIYNPATDQWETGDLIPEGRRRGAAGAALYQDKIYVSCGLQNGHIGDHRNWVDQYDLNTGAWKILPDAPRTRDHFNAVVAEDKMYLTAGRNTMTDESPFSRTVGKVDVYDFKTMKWITLENEIPTKRAGNTAILFQKEILVIGGESDTQELAHSEVEALNIDSHQWRSMAPMVTGRHGTGVIHFDGGLCIASGCGKRGGNPELQSMEIFK